MGTKLTLLVTCTDRKSAPVTPALRVRTLPDLAIEDRVATWSQRLASADGRRPLRSLYQGETWTQVGRLEQVAKAAGYEPRVIVASAGLGLREVDYLAPAYGATFSRPHADAVGASTAEARKWWQHLHFDGSNRPALEGPSIWVLSESYAAVVGQEFLAASAPSELLIFGGSTSMDAVARVPSNRSLRSALGGTANSLNLRMATKWLELSGPGGAFAPAARSRWNAWASAAHKAEVYQRTVLTDDAVREFIRSLHRLDSKLTKSRALRRLRDAGYACEQRRFNTLFDSMGASA